MLSIMMNPYSESLEYHVFQHILDEGVDTQDRTGVGCRKVLNINVVWPSDTFPISTVRPLGLRYAWEEMKFFLSGSNNTKELEEKGIKFWVGNTSREFLDKQGLTNLPEGSLGSAYSKQFRRAGASTSPEYIDQLDNLVRGLKSDPYSRRHSIDLWGITEQHNMPLLPCWWRSNWAVLPKQDGRKELHLKLYSRSNDFLLGYWQAAMQYRMLQTFLADLLGYDVGYMVTDLWDVHIYNNQYEYIYELLSREDGTPPRAYSLNKEVNKLEDVSNVDSTDFILEGYKPNTDKFVTPRPQMAV